MKCCKLCEKSRYANTSWCWKHFRERERVKREEKARKKDERRKGTKKYQVSETKLWHRKTWRLMSEWVRRSGANFSGYSACYTCHNTFFWKELHAGHFQHGKLDFDGRNLKPQCASCNTYHGGRLDIYTLRLIEENGKEWIDKLRWDAAQHKGYSLPELKGIYADLTEKLSSLIA